MKLSACIIAKDEEAQIARAIESVLPVADEVVVVDTGSTDATAPIAASLGALVVPFVWCDDFSAAYNFCIDQARGEWILQLDADEELIESSREAMLLAIADPAILAYTVLRRDRFDADSDDYTKMLHVRLFRNRHDLRFIGRIHHQFFTPLDEVAQRTGLRFGHSPIEILHHGYAMGDANAKLVRAARLMELELTDRPGQFYYLVELGRTWLKMRDERGVELLTQAATIVKEEPSIALHHRTVFATLLEHVLACDRLPAGFPLSHQDAVQLTLLHFPTAVPLLWQLALRAFKSGDFRRSAEFLETILKLGETHEYDKGYSFQPDIMRGDAVLNLGVCYASLGQHARAQRCFESLVSHVKHGPRARMNLKRIGGRRKR